MTKKSSDPLLIETSTTLKIMNQNLFGGNGQVGALHFIMEQHKELSAKIDANKTELLDRIDAKKKETDDDVQNLGGKYDSVNGKVNRIIGWGGALGFAATSFLTWLGIHGGKH